MNAGGASAAGANTGGTSAAGASTGGVSAGGVSAAGASAAGATGHGGGKGSLCEIKECFVAITCLDKCGGVVVSSGCCACVPPTVNQATCSGAQ